jgi:hypothetical protein
MICIPNADYFVLIFNCVFSNQLGMGVHVYHAFMAQLFIKIKSTTIFVTIGNSLLELLNYGI